MGTSQAVDLYWWSGRFLWGAAGTDTPSLGSAIGATSADSATTGDRSQRRPDPLLGNCAAASSALDARRCALTVGQFPEGRTLAADEADLAAVLLPLGQLLFNMPDTAHI